MSTERTIKCKGPATYSGPPLFPGDLASLEILEGAQVAVIRRRGRTAPVTAFIGSDGYVVGMLSAAWRKGGGS